MNVRILNGDALTMLRTLESESVQCVVTSPPYFHLRDYGVDGQIGLEKTPSLFIAALLAVFEEIRRVLRPDGLCFVNLSDSYSGGGRGTNDYHRQRIGANTASAQALGPMGEPGGIPSKNLLLIPERFAISMQDAGWIVRSRIAWCKTSAMPESVKDRPTSAWEPIWMFAKSARYFYDGEAVRSELKAPDVKVPQGFGGHKRNGGTTYSGNAYDASQLGGANLRNYWLLGPEPSRLEHYAGFPTELPRRCILAGSRPGDTVLDPFLGSGTTALVADRLGRDAIGIELNETYAAMARRRIESDAPMFVDAVTDERPVQAPLLERIG